ncbi:copper chaperone CopZ [Halobacillus shinanisalinarum]|uniref:Copper chaperone CopZ n=1 Tax=Halobacillus shinanisalinarum TaxID=2932258 RepID=A0ABY4H4K9_9BACI|nr:copper chaperone CopZ [Halobacillus shinanisalinarum]UOQ95151.1 copper chaperone CopZ [Halobacillus shinanisalinarum]
MQTTLQVKGMTCGHCEAAVKGALKDLNGVQDVNVDLTSGRVDVSYDGDVSNAEMEEAIEEQGYDVVS